MLFCKFHKMVLLTLIICVSVFLVTGIEADMSYTVVPGASPSNCTGNQTECSLMYYASHPDKFFRENETTFRFQAGDHSLMNSTLVLMTNISNLTLIGDTNSSSNVIEARVVCSGDQAGGFSFNNIINLTIENLNFVRCSTRSQNFHVLIALEIQLPRDLTMNNISIQDTIGYGLMLDTPRGHSVIEKTSIERSHSTNHDYGGNFALYCSDSHSSHADPRMPDHLTIVDSNFINGSNFYNNRSFSGGIHIQITCHINISIVFDHVNVFGNQADKGGNIGISYQSTYQRWAVSISILNSNISLGRGNVGGGLYMTAIAESNSMDYKGHDDILIVKNTHFEHNSASSIAAAVYLRLHQNYYSAVGKVVFQNCTFKRNYLNVTRTNSRSHGGVGLHVVTYALPEYHQHRTVFFEINLIKCTFVENHVYTDGFVSIPRTGALYVQYTRSMSIKDCKFIKNNCTGVVAIHSNVLLRGTNMIRGNNATKGGGMLFCASSMMHLCNGTKLVIANNNASQYGGGIYVEDDCSQIIPYCFFQVDNITADNATLHHTQVIFTNNTAQAGSAIYGGLIGNCILFDTPSQKYHHYYSSKVFTATFHYDCSKESVISSNALYVGFCNDNQQDCTQQNTHKHVLPGNTFQVSTVLMGQYHGLVSGVVVAECISKSCSVQKHYQNQYVTNRNLKPTNLTYAVLLSEASYNETVLLELVAEDYYSGYPTYRYKPSLIYVHIQQCPLAFQFSPQAKKCLCILEHTQCNITNQTIIRSSPRWIGYIQKRPNDTRRIINHPFCPLGYCLNTNVTISTTNKTFDQDVQCAQHRSGLLCGKCKQNYSLGFGSSQCLHCQSDVSVLRVIGLIAVCAVAGVLLVVLLTLLNLTVAEGTLNGLIFYANILQVNQDIFFPPETHARPLTAFIAWLNLDFGITVCFYDGMDAHAKTLLQFLFPLYIWLISGGIIYFSWKSNRVARLTGKNAVKVLATLFLLSFGKLMRTVIAVIQYTDINKHINMRVWLLDASVLYLHGKHITLCVMAVLVGVISLLYTLILTFIQCLRRAPNHRVGVWVQKLKPLLDAYTGPYKDRYHFWTGFLLLIRIVLFVSFAYNLRMGPKFNFTMIIIVSSLLIAALRPGVYRHQFVGLLEVSMYVNLILFSIVMMFLIDHHKSKKEIATYVFGGWALLVFLVVIVYHTYKQFTVFPKLLVLCKEKLWVCTRRDYTAIQPVLIQRDDSDESEESEDECELEYPPWSTPRVRESLMRSTQ